MTNPISTSQNISPVELRRQQARNKIKELAAKGEWPPEGHPWKALTLLPRQQVEQFFQEETWQTVLRGLSQLRADAIDTALNTSKPQALRDEAAGQAKTIKIVLDLEKEIKGVFKVIEDAKRGEPK